MTEKQLIENQLWISAGLVVVSGKDPIEARQALLELAEITRDEPGCCRFELLQHCDSPDRFTLWERWDDEAALQAHFEASHTRAYLARGLTEVTYIERLQSLTHQEPV